MVPERHHDSTTKSLGGRKVGSQTIEIVKAARKLKSDRTVRKS